MTTPVHAEERRKKVLTPEDVKVLRGELKQLFEEHTCQFSAAEVQIVRDFISIYKETRSTVLKLAIGAFFSLVLVLLVLGVRHNVIVPK